MADTQTQTNFDEAREKAVEAMNSGDLLLSSQNESLTAFAKNRSKVKDGGEASQNIRFNLMSLPGMTPEIATEVALKVLAARKAKTKAKNGVGSSRITIQPEFSKIYANEKTSQIHIRTQTRFGMNVAEVFDALPADVRDASNKIFRENGLDEVSAGAGDWQTKGGYPHQIYMTLDNEIIGLELDGREAHSKRNEGYKSIAGKDGEIGLTSQLLDDALAYVSQENFFEGYPKGITVDPSTYVHEAGSRKGERSNLGFDLGLLQHHFQIPAGTLLSDLAQGKTPSAMDSETANRVTREAKQTALGIFVSRNCGLKVERAAGIGEGKRILASYDGRSPTFEPGSREAKTYDAYRAAALDRKRADLKASGYDGDTAVVNDGAVQSVGTDVLIKALENSYAPRPDVDQDGEVNVVPANLSRVAAPRTIMPGKVINYDPGLFEAYQRAQGKDVGDGTANSTGIPTFKPGNRD